MKQTKVKNLLTTILTEVSPNTACFLDPRMAVQEVLPLLLIILQPTFRPVSVAGKTSELLTTEMPSDFPHFNFLNFFLTLSPLEAPGWGGG